MRETPRAAGADAFRALAARRASGADWPTQRLRPRDCRRDRVREVIRNVRAEFDLMMGLAGCVAVAEINRGMLARVA
jgi:hypothetical protein